MKIVLKPFRKEEKDGLYDFIETIQTCKQTAILWGEIHFLHLCIFSYETHKVKFEHTNGHTLSCLTILVVLNFCRIVWQTGQVAPALCSAERGQRGAGQMAPSTMFSHWLHCHSWSDWSPYLSCVLSQFSESHGSHEREGKERELVMVPAWITQANKKPNTDNQIQRTHEWLNRPFPLYLTHPLLSQTWVVCFHHRHRMPLTSTTLTCQFVALNSTGELIK